MVHSVSTNIATVASLLTAMNTHILRCPFILPAGSDSYDVALLKLPRALELNDYVNVLCLPDANTNIQVGDLCTATGWGLDETGGKIEFTPKC